MVHYTAQLNYQNSKTSQTMMTMHSEYQNCQSWMQLAKTIHESIHKWMTV
jgi:hypothetical protein